MQIQWTLNTGDLLGFTCIQFFNAGSVLTFHFQAYFEKLYLRLNFSCLITMYRNKTSL